MMNARYCLSALRNGALIALSASLLSACVTGTTPTQTFYTLSSASAVDAPSPVRSTTALAVGPVDFPDYLDRPQIITRAGGQRLTMDEFHRWAGSLQEDTTRVLVQNLSEQLQTDQVFIYPNRLAIRPTHRVALNVRQFDGELNGEVVLDVAWSLLEGHSNRILDNGQRRYRVNVSRADYDAYVSALSAALTALSRDIANAVKRQGL